MKRILQIALSAAVLLSCLGLTSCDSDGWYPDPPYGWSDAGYDYRLNGMWELITADSRPVTGYAVNYLYFNGKGGGRYYFYNNGYHDSEAISYYCYSSDNSTSNYQVNIRYEDSNRATMNYWFAGGRLFMQWRLTTTGEPVTYVYQQVNNPW